MHLVFDTETTGKLDYKLPADHPTQPRLVQLGAILYDEQRKVRGEINAIVRPDDWPNDWKVPDEAASVHGITTEYALKFGVPIRELLYTFSNLVANVRKAKGTYVAHNSAFDVSMIERETFLLGKRPLFLDATSIFCTMKAMTPLCKIPGQYGDFKWPRLQEAYTYCFQKQFDGAHDAMADVRAAAEIYFWLLDQKKPIEPGKSLP